MSDLVAIVLHDVAPATWPACQRVLQCVAAIAPLPVTLLVVPRYHRNPPDLPVDAWLAWLDAAAARGDELALHGYTHLDEGQPQGWVDRLRRRCYTAGEGEFSSLSHTEAAWRLKAGLRWFRQHDWPLHGFVAPAWLMSEGTWTAIRELRFAYTCTLSRLVAFPSGRSLQSQSIVYSTRAGWRRSLSLPWNAMVARRQRQAPLLRFELHPGDADYDAIRDSWTGLLRHALADGRRAVTLDQAVRELLPQSGQ
ncbi:MAG: DUF2334 domain-containing protein [Betaproteobacteria bacterium]